MYYNNKLAKNNVPKSSQNLAANYDLKRFLISYL